MKQIDQSEFMASRQLKKMIPQLLLSLSLFSFVFSYSSFYSPHPPKFHHYFSGNHFHLPTGALNKNCLFLICNGLLVFLAKTSGLIRPPPPPSHDLDDLLQKRIGDSLQTALEKYVLEEVTRETKLDEIEDRSGESTKEISIFIAESEEEGGEREGAGKGEGGGGGASELEEDVGKGVDLTDSRSFWLFEDEQLYGEEVEEEEEEEREEMSTEELNQKFEDFIRRMKEEIIINEARQKAVVLK